MKKLKVVIAMIIMPFLYSAGCEEMMGPVLNKIYELDTQLSELAEETSLINDEAARILFEADKLLAEHDASRSKMQGLMDELSDTDNSLWLASESGSENVIFMTANTVMLAGIIMPIILQVPIDDNWDATCALEYQTQSSNITRGFVLNKKSDSYKTSHLVLAEGKPEFKDGKIVLKEPKIYKPHDDGTYAQVLTYHHGKPWLAIHKKDSEWVNFRPMPKDQEKRLITEVRRINRVKSNSNVQMEALKIE